MTSNKELHYKYNFFYLTSILTITIVCLITVQWGSIDKLVDYISFGLTITSLFLALIAIFYAIVSSTTFSASLGKLEHVTQKVVMASSDLADFSKELNNKLSEIPFLIKNVETKIDHTRNEIKEKNIIERASIEQDSTGVTFSNVEAEINSVVELLLNRSSFIGIIAIYTAQKAYLSKKPFDITKVWSSIEFINYDYCVGYLAAISSIGIIDHKSKDNMWSIIQMSDKIPDQRDNLVKWLVSCQLSNVG